MSITTKITDIRDCVESPRRICEYNYLDLNSEVTQVVRSRITIDEIEDKLFQLQKVRVSQDINGKFLYPHNEALVFEDLLKLARKGQLINVIHLDMGWVQSYYLVVSILDQHLIWKICGSTWSGRNAS
ncbi:hypothetical protein [Fuchsiella alkaliacetigena]|uniref:hypothetical protein n=1 Tax=Fuchsiella alkaliacetigena TaxID=957042 RepID=UPI00200A9F4B|nr:hypothetical protein [Fuchsiella alkaliacetigena]MCK8824704.1 hypothetical protein [Fuchsiella alkaliacetigena]